MDLPADVIEKLQACRQQKEPVVRALEDKDLWFQEKWLQFPGKATFTFDDWGVRVSFESEHYPQVISLSSRWDYLMVWKDSIGATYGGWSLDLEPIYPELGINTSR